MKFVFGVLLILSGSLMTAEPIPERKLFAENAPDAQQASNRLDPRIQSPEPGKYEDILDGNDWLNPYLVIGPDGIEVKWKVSSVERKVVPGNELRKMLISLPVAAWPYGRIAAVQEIALRNGRPNTEVWRKDQELIEKNRLEVNKILASLGVKIKLWPSN